MHVSELVVGKQCPMAKTTESNLLRCVYTTPTAVWAFIRPDPTMRCQEHIPKT